MLHRLHLTNEPADLALVPGQLPVPRIPLDNGGSKCTRHFDVKQPKPNLRKMPNSEIPQMFVCNLQAPTAACPNRIA